jgi:hypothetical protein
MHVVPRNTLKLSTGLWGNIRRLSLNGPGWKLASMYAVLAPLDVSAGYLSYLSTGRAAVSDYMWLHGLDNSWKWPLCPMS